MTDNATELAPGADLELLEAGAALSRLFGEDPQFSRAGGGNSSAKTDEVLYIKPSGVSLASMTAAALMPLALAPLLELADGAPGDAPPGSEAVMRTAMAARLRDEGDRRPSVECVFHALIPSRFVIHTHPTLVNSLTCARDGEAIAKDLLGDDALWVPYVDPGLPLAREIARLRRCARRADGSRSPRRHPPPEPRPDRRRRRPGGRRRPVVRARRRAAAARGGRAIRRGCDPSAADPATVDRLSRVLGRRLATGPQPLAVAFDGSADAAWLAGTAEGEALARGGPLMPDQIVYAGSWPLWIEPAVDDEAGLDALVAAAVAAYVATRGERPIIVVVAGVGVFAVGGTPRQAETAREIYLDATRVGRGALRLGGVRPLATAERRFIETWEAEAYRRGIEPQPGAEARSSLS